MAEVNTTPEIFDDQQALDGYEPQTKEEIKEDTLLNEAELLDGLLELAEAKNDPNNYKMIEIRRGGVLKLQFRLRALSEQEMTDCRKRATQYTKAKGGQPRKPIETNLALMRSLMIYCATVDEDRKKLWDSQKAKAKLNIIEGHDMIDIVLLGGEKDRVMEELDDLNGYNYEEADTVAKN